MGTLIVIVVAAILSPLVGIVFAYIKGKSQKENAMSFYTSHQAAEPVFNPSITIRTRLSSHHIPDNPRFYNIGAKIYHKNRDCLVFADDMEWEAATEGEALALGLRQCPMCEKQIAFVYSHARVYHTSRWCSSADSTPKQLFEEEAIAKGLRKCKACQKRDGA